jgi:hypothetical protein
LFKAEEVKTDKWKQQATNTVLYSDKHKINDRIRNGELRYDPSTNI